MRVGENLPKEVLFLVCGWTAAWCRTNGPLLILDVKEILVVSPVLNVDWPTFVVVLSACDGEYPYSSFLLLIDLTESFFCFWICVKDSNTETMKYNMTDYWSLDL